MYRPLSRAVNAASRLLPLTWSRALRFRYVCGYWPSLSSPVTLGEKINWRVVRDRRDIWAWTCDKVEMKREVHARAPEALIPEVLWQGPSLTDDVAAAVSGKWILKSSTGSGKIIPGDGTPQLHELRAAVDRWDVHRQGSLLGEWAYTLVPPTLFFERWVGEATPTDYKVFVFDGVARFITVHTDRFSGHRASIYRPDWSRVDARLPRAPEHAADVPRPQHLERLVAIAEKIGAGFDFIRVDLFETEEGVWFGETTPYPWSGLGPLIPLSFEIEAGSYWALPDLDEADALRG